MYLAKYVAKSEYPVLMHIQTASTKCNDACETYLKGRVVSLLEAVTLVQQLSHIISTREIIYLPVDAEPPYRMF